MSKLTKRSQLNKVIKRFKKVLSTYVRPAVYYGLIPGVIFAGMQIEPRPRRVLSELLSPRARVAPLTDLPDAATRAIHRPQRVGPLLLVLARLMHARTSRDLRERTEPHIGWRERHSVLQGTARGTRNPKGAASLGAFPSARLRAHRDKEHESSAGGHKPLNPPFHAPGHGPRGMQDSRRHETSFNSIRSPLLPTFT